LKIKGVIMDVYSNDEKSYLIDLAKTAIYTGEIKSIIQSVNLEKISSNLKKERGVFVTIYKNGGLRGCIGYILPVIPLYNAVIENAYNAAYKDPRFLPLKKEEVKELDVEISVLTLPQKLNYDDSKDLLDKLEPLKDGVIIRKGFSSATFLPQVWEQLLEKKDFLSHLCLKAGLPKDEWEKGKLDIELYRAIVFGEKRKNK